MEKEMNKVSSAIKRKLREDWEKVCNSYLLELLNMWGLEARYGYWIGDEVGGVYDYDTAFTINIDDIIYCVENDVTECEYIDWQDYVSEAAMYGFNTPNLKSWMKGCPRVDREVFDRLSAVKKSFDDIIKEEKDRMKKEDERKREACGEVIIHDGKEYEWVSMETQECHCYNCALFRGGKCVDMDLCKNPNSTFRGFFKEVVR